MNNEYLGDGACDDSQTSTMAANEAAHTQKTPEHLAEFAALVAELEAKSTSTDPLESVKSLKDNGENPTPPPPLGKPLETPLEDLNAEPEMLPKDENLPRDPPPNEAGRMGNCGATFKRRLPSKDEFIDERGNIMPHVYWHPPKPQPKRRKLATLGSLADIERELAKLYADYHHFRINAAHYTRGVYGLTQLATVMRMAEKGKLNSETAAAHNSEHKATSSPF